MSDEGQKKLKMLQELTEVAVIMALAAEEPTAAAKTIAKHVAEMIETAAKTADVEIAIRDARIEELAAENEGLREDVRQAEGAYERVCADYRSVKEGLGWNAR